MASPRKTSITVDGSKFDALATHMGVHTAHDHSGMPLMGSLVCSISCVVDANDDVNVPFATLQKLWELANLVTRDKVKDIKIDFWKDENQEDVICSYKFRGWIASFSMDGGGEGNHVLNLQLQPELGKLQYVEITLGN